MARDHIVWRPTVMLTEGHGKRKVYVKHYAVPSVGLLAAPDTAFTIPAYITVGGKRVKGYVSANDGMAWQQDHDKPVFRAYKDIPKT